MSESKTARLVEVLRREMAEGRYRPGQAIPSERQLSETFDFSRTTIRRAIDLLVTEGLLVRRAGAGTFAAGPAHEAARSAPPARTPVIAFIIPTFSDPAYGEMVDGIEQEARRRGLRVIAGQSNYQPDTENELLTAYGEDPTVRGAILVPASVDAPLPGATAFIGHGKPLVYLGRWPRGSTSDGISADYRQGAALAVGHLVGHGHRRIAFADGRPHLPGFSLLDGYAEALRAAGLPVDPALVQQLDLPLAQAGLEAVRALRQARTQFTAIFARNDVTATGVVRGLNEAGLDIPRDVSVVSMNNSQLAQHMEPPLTSVDAFPVMLGRQAFQRLQERMSGGYDGPARYIYLQPRLAVRGSSGAAPALARAEA
jgi:DNA-binding LacI/PurR family transcriptional regulator